MIVPMRPDERSEPAPRRQIHYFCAAGHDSQIWFAAEAASRGLAVEADAFGNLTMGMAAAQSILLLLVLMLLSGLQLRYLRPNA